MKPVRARLWLRSRTYESVAIRPGDTDETVWPAVNASSLGREIDRELRLEAFGYLAAWPMVLR